MRRVQTEFRSIHGRGPSDAELADALNMAPDELRGRQRDLIASDVTSLNTLVLAHEEAVVLSIDLTVAIAEVECYLVRDFDREERTPRHRARQPEEARKEVRGHALVPRVDDRMVQLDRHDYVTSGRVMDGLLRTARALTLALRRRGAKPDRAHDTVRGGPARGHRPPPQWLSR